MGGQQVALDVGGDEVQRLARRRSVLPGQAPGDPGRQLRQFRRVAFDGDAGLLERREPGRLARLPVELGQGDQRDDPAPRRAQ